MSTVTAEEKKVLSLGFIGVGWIGRNRMEVLINSGLATAAVISEPSAENAAQALLSVPEATVANSPEEAVANEDIDGIVIATPSALHAEQSLKALDAGKHVFCQKPLGRTAAEVKAITEASAKAGKFLAVDLSYRHTKAMRAVHEMVSSGEIGKIYAAELIFHNAYGPDKSWFYDVKQSGGGCVMDLGIHLVDTALWCLGFPEIAQVRSRLYHQGKIIENPEETAEDFASVMMTTENDVTINLQCSWNISAGKDAVIEARFYGTGGGVAFKNINGSFYDFTAEKYTGTQTEILFSGEDNWSGRAGIVWAEALLAGQGYDAQSASEFIKTARIIDRIYGRQS
ncbi:MAG TPA: Gfo/Idh/MocA family oxidoreductase [Flavobacterium sp.]|jgi:predicted dehydrogenase